MELLQIQVQVQAGVWWAVVMEIRSEEIMRARAAALRPSIVKCLRN